MNSGAASTVNDVTPVCVTISNPMVTSCTVPDLVTGETYRASLVWTNEIGDGALSTPVEIACLAKPEKPTSPPAFSLASYSAPSITFTWVAPPNGGSELTHYEFEIQEVDSNGADIALNLYSMSLVASSAVTVTDAGLVILTHEFRTTGGVTITAGSRYKLRFAGKNALGTGSYSEWSEPYYVFDVPDTPNDLARSITATPAGGSAGNGRVYVTWSHSVNMGGAVATDMVYELTYTTDGTNTYCGSSFTGTITVGGLLASEKPAANFIVPAGQYTCVKVRAKNKGSVWSAWTNVEQLLSANLPSLSGPLTCCDKLTSDDRGGCFIAVPKPLTDTGGSPLTGFKWIISNVDTDIALSGTDFYFTSTQVSTSKPAGWALSGCATPLGDVLYFTLGSSECQEPNDTFFLRAVSAAGMGKTSVSITTCAINSDGTVFVEP
eukprot:GDKI01031333.1.p1 GENE.GDKI01031333.1~~GDKI01031333.1.p1  ORF type:complete len:483 (-),score=124.83 GDKI01031333.1:56-1363(-)